MTLRRKFLVTFGGLALLALLVAGVTVWATARWQQTDVALQGHYQRSLELQRVRVALFASAKELGDAVLGTDPDARAEHAAALAPARRDFAVWERLADSDGERREVAQVRAAFDRVAGEGERVLELASAGRSREATVALEALEDSFDHFTRVSDAAVRADRARRRSIRAETARTRATARLVLLVAAFGTLSLAMLVAAYLRADLFAPLRDVQGALDGVAQGDRAGRLPEARDDELGGVGAAFNRMVAAIAAREEALHAAGAPLAGAPLARSEAASPTAGAPRDGDQPSRLTLHRLVAQLRARVQRLHEHEREGEGGPEAPRLALLDDVDRLLQAVARVTEFGFPLDLNLARADVRALLYDAVTRYQDALVSRGVSVELGIGPEVGEATIDRLKMREAVAELVENALDALPERGGRIGMRAFVDPAGPDLVIEVADDGRGADGSSIDRALDAARWDDGGAPSVGLRLTRALIEQHGGHLRIQSQPGVGTHAQIRLPHDA